MKAGFCKKCPKISACTLEYKPELNEWVVTCKRMRAELWRVENPRRKGRIEVVYEAEMEGLGHCKFINCVWGDSDDK